MRSLIGISLLGIASQAYAGPQLSRISVKDNRFVDSAGRVRIFRGFNDAANSPGQGESMGPFDGTNYMPRVLMSNDTRLEELIDTLGFNSYRIQAAWSAVQPSPPDKDGNFEVETDYLDVLEGVAQKLAAFGAYSLLDMHQDGLSVNYGSYDGIPQWLANLTTPRHAYPWPYKDGHTDTPEAPSQTFGEIYHNTHGGLDAWAAAWAAFAERFKTSEHILGYELMNEPWAGDVYHDPTLLLPGVAGKRSLQPAYDVVAEAIRAIDNETLVFFEPVVYGMLHDSEKTVQKLLGSGFDHAPGGAQYGDKSVFSFHYYCWLSQRGSGDDYPLLEKLGCDKILGPAVFNAVEETRERLGGASMMTEFGGSYFSPDASKPKGRAQEDLLWLLDKADSALESWSFWDLGHFYDYPESTPGCRGDLDCTNLKVLSRPYAQAIAGEPKRMKFDVGSGVFTLEMVPAPVMGAPTEIFLPPHVYSSGYDVTVSDESHVTWKLCDRPNAICVFATTDKAVTISVTPKEHSERLV